MVKMKLTAYKRFQTITIHTNINDLKQKDEFLRNILHSVDSIKRSLVSILILIFRFQYISYFCLQQTIEVFA